MLLCHSKLPLFRSHKGLILPLENSLGQLSYLCSVLRINPVYMSQTAVGFVILHTKQEGSLIHTPPSLSRDVYAWLLLIHQQSGAAVGGFLQV